MKLSLRRARTLALITFVIGCLAIWTAIKSSPNFLKVQTDFSAFYNAGRILNEGGALYDRQAQVQMYRDLVPVSPDSQILLYAYSPFFALIFTPLAIFSYETAFVLWAIISWCIFTVGFWFLLQAAEIRVQHRVDSYLIALSFLPFFAWCVLGGQTSTFGFLAICLAVYFDRTDQRLISGICLSLLLYKPPLIILFVPMLFVTNRWRTFAGLCLGASMLGLLSLTIIQLDGIAQYRSMIADFARLKASGARPTNVEIDLYSQLLIWFGWPAKVLFAACAIFVAPFLINAWRKDTNVWALTITATLVLNFYVLLHDATLVIISVVLIAPKLMRLKGFRWFLVILFLAPWAETYGSRHGFQPVTFALIGFAVYQLLMARTLPHIRRPPEFAHIVSLGDQSVQT